MKSSLRVIGVMTGTSCDALDASCLNIEPDGWLSEWSGSVKLPKELRSRILKFQEPGTKLSWLQMMELDRDLGIWYGDSISNLLRDPVPDVISIHGQTIAHFPDLKKGGATLQVGNPAWISSKTGLTVISHFRSGDIAAGGQGAPLAPLFHQALVQALGQGTGIAIHNIGGISNLTYIGKKNEIVAFDTGPGNIWIDEATSRMTSGKSSFDRNGAIARRGNLDERKLLRLLQLPYLKKSPPKSTGRDDFPFAIFERVAGKKQSADSVRLATQYTAVTIAQAYKKWVTSKKLPLKSVYVCGGGAKNGFLMELLQELMHPVSVASTQEIGIDPQLMESQAFAFFGFLSLFGTPLGGPWTGSKKRGPGAQITPGKNWLEVLDKIGSISKSWG